LVSPIRRLRQNPRAILNPFVSAGMTVLELGTGMGFFTLELARMVGPRGRVIAVDIQPRMLETLIRRAIRAGLRERIDVRLANGVQTGTENLDAAVDFVFAFAVVHELPNTAAFFAEIVRCLKSGGRLFVSEPKPRVTEEEFGRMIELAGVAGFSVESRPEVRRSQSVVFVRTDSAGAKAP